MLLNQSHWQGHLIDLEYLWEVKSLDLKTFKATLIDDRISPFAFFLTQINELFDFSVLCFVAQSSLTLLLPHGL